MSGTRERVPRERAAGWRAVTGTSCSSSHGRSSAGVTLVKGRVDAAGRPALGLGRVAEGWLNQELLLDPSTYAYLGTVGRAEGPHEPQNLTVRLRAGIVDEAGQRP